MTENKTIHVKFIHSTTAWRYVNGVRVPDPPREPGPYNPAAFVLLDKTEGTDDPRP